MAATCCTHSYCTEYTTDPSGLCAGHRPAAVSAYDDLTAKVKALAVEFPGITFGYIGNCGVDRSGPFDDRSWRVFLPHPGRVGTLVDNVNLGPTDRLADVDWPRIERAVRHLYPRYNRT